MKKLCTTVSLLALMAGSAFAQTTVSPPADQNAPATQQTAPAAPALSGDQISSKELLKESVKNAANETVGDINDVLIDNDGKIAAVIIGVGGFLGMGEKNVALPFTELMFSKDSDNDLMVTTKATKESLQAAPEYKKPEDRS